MWFEKMGIYGMSAIEDIIIAGLVTGDPVLLIGTHGTAKTTLCRKLAEALSMKFFAYDASKALFEDIIGFPNPESISKGTIEYIPTKLSLWDKEFILIDEISRARAETQNKWLEVVRSRQVMGLKAGSLKYIFAAMNPPSYAGAYPLDEALAGRFAFIIKAPEAVDMQEKDVKMIMNNVTEDDGAAIYKGNEIKMTEQDKNAFIEFIKASRENMELVKGALNSKLDEYLLKFIFLCSNRDIKIDGRRLNMLKRNIIAYISVIAMKSSLKTLDFYALRGEVLKAVMNSMPFDAIDVEVSAMKIKSIHNFVCDFIGENNGSKMIYLKTTADVDSLNDDLIRENYQFIKSSLTKLCEKINSKNHIEEKPAAIRVLKRLVTRIGLAEITLEINDIERVFELYRHIYDMSAARKYNFSGLPYLAYYVNKGILSEKPEELQDFKIVFNTYRSEDRDEADLSLVKEGIKIFRNYSGKE